jgi:signal transduction histidine kinase/DNA-binding NarL/FixJ family response regulator
VLSQDKAVKSDDVYNDPLLAGIADLMRELELKSVLVVRTSYQGKPNGIICLEQCDRFRHWTDEEIELLEAVAVQMGIALAQANLLKQEKQRRQELAVQNHALEKAKLEAEAANRAKSQFLSKMSHELRTPLNAILGFTQVMARDESVGREHQEHLEIINRSGEHLLDLINDILSMSKIEAGQVTLNENRIDLYRLLDSLEEMLRFKAVAKGIELIFERSLGIPRYIQTDDSKLRQVLINLLGNAIKFTQTGRVTLRVQEVGEEGSRGGEESVNSSTPPPLYPCVPLRLRFEVEDTGPGIAPDELDNLFDPFVQTETGRQSMEGTGLGLPISQQFVHMMGGEIAVKSILHQGTIFTFEIQASLAAATDEKPILSQRRIIGLETNQPTYRILVVEDATVNRKLLVKILEPLGFEVRTATNGQEGVALWESWSPHLILMDVIMPIMDGYEATQRIKQTSKSRKTVIIALTASAFDEQRDAIIRVGCDDFISKPFQREELLEKMAHHLRVRYVYEEQLVPPLPPSPNPKTPLTPEALAVMPVSWVIQLHQAALYADDELMRKLIKQIPVEHDALRQSLKGLIDNFRLEQLIDLTELGES